MNHEKVLIVEDEENERTGLAELVTGWGYRAETARDGAEGLEKVTSWAPSIVVTDMKMPRMGGLELLEKLATDAQTMAVVVVTAQGTIDSAVQAMRMGAYDYITKPIDTNRLRTILQNASALLGTRAELEVTRRKLRDAGSLGSLIGSSKKMQEIFHLIEMVSPSTASVLITGASGTGKELVARTVHELSPRRNKPFVPINCAAIPETLIESEIFGHEKGAFTGALERRTGCFELAEGGTLLLDEIGEMPVATQAKLLRVLEDRKLRRLGSKVETTVDVRVLAATNKVPEEAVARGELRNDLYYRLNVFNIHMPPLREHKEDVPELVHGPAGRHERKTWAQGGRGERGRPQRVSELLLAGQCARNAQHPGARNYRVRRSGGRNQASAPGVRTIQSAQFSRGFRHRAPGRGNYGRRGRKAADPENAGGHEQQQDAGRGNSGHQPEDFAQQAQGVRQRHSRRGFGEGGIRQLSAFRFQISLLAVS